MANEKIGVVGAGLMGAEIALVYALAGHDVLLSDTGEANLAAALTRLGGITEKGIARGFYKADETAPALARIATTTDLARFADRDMVTEAVFEDEAVKAAIWRRLDAVCASDCLFATNTSSIAISALASYVGEARRARFLGTHYFSPVSRMKLVEIISAFETAPATVETAMRLSLQVQEILFEAYGERFRPPALLKQKVKAGYIGKKAGKGWRTEDK